MQDSYNDIPVPADGQAIEYKDGKYSVPDNPIIPFIEGDGTGRDIWKASQRVFDAAVEKAYGGRDKANELLQKMRQDGLLGRKTGAGFYKYEGKAQTPNDSLEKWRGKGDKFAGDIARG